jgi:RNA polymerase sigma-70 factor, ECF subfamily
MRHRPSDRAAAERRFAEVFAHLRLIRAYASRRGAHDGEAIAAEVMAIAWRRLADVPQDDPRPWLIATARNLLLAEHRRHGRRFDDLDDVQIAAPEELPAPSLDLDPDLQTALSCLSPRDREAVLLVAWEDLTPAAAAASLGISAATFRVRLHRARRRLMDQLWACAQAEPQAPDDQPQPNSCRPSLEQL